MICPAIWTSSTASPLEWACLGAEGWVIAGIRLSGWEGWQRSIDLGRRGGNRVRGDCSTNSRIAGPANQAEWGANLRQMPSAQALLTTSGRLYTKCIRLAAGHGGCRGPDVAHGGGV